MDDWSSVKSSLGALRDNTVDALEHSNLGLALEGLDAYASVLAAIASQETVLAARRASSAPPALRGYGREWDQAIRDLYVVADVASTSRSLRTWVEVVAWFRRMISNFAAAGTSIAVRDLLSVFQSMWTTMLQHRGTDFEARQSTYLLHLAELNSHGRWPLLSDSSEQIHWHFARTFADLFRAAVVEGAPEAATLVLNYFEHGFHNGPETLRRSSTCLVLFGWLLYMLERGTEVNADVWQALGRGLDQASSLVQILEYSMSEEVESALNWTWWEIRPRGPVSSGVLQMSTYVDLAAVSLSSTHPMLGWSESELSGSTAQRLVGAIDSLLSGAYPRISQMHLASEEALGRLRQQLQAQVDRANIAREMELHRSPLDEGRVERFVESLDTTLAAERRRSFVTELAGPFADPDIHKANFQFGLDTLLAKYYFAPSDVHADPVALAQELTDSVIRGEQETVLGVVIDPAIAAAETVSLDAAIRRIADELTRRSARSAVVVTNSSLAFIALTSSGTNSDEGHVGEAPVFRVYDDRPPYVALLSRSEAPRILRGISEPVVEGDRELVTAQVVAGVSIPAPETLQEIIDRQPRTPIEEARLRATVRVRVQEFLHVDLPRPDRLVILRIPEDAL